MNILEDIDNEPGFIVLHRKALKSVIWQRANDCVLALTILLKANWEDKKWQSKNGDVIEIKRGELVTSLKSLKEDSKLSIKNIRTSLMHLEKAEFLASTSTNHYRHIKVINYSKYQDYEKPSGKQSGKHSASTRQRLNNSNNNNNTDMFTSFYAEYPRKQGKAAAIRAWEKLNPGEELCKQIIAAVQAQAASENWVKDDGKFIPHPATWLNGRRWEDEVENGLPGFVSAIEDND